MVRVPTEEIEVRVLVYKRPSLDAFLREASKHYEICVWTEACRTFSTSILDAIDPDGLYITKRLFREHCSFKGDGTVLKDIFRVQDRARSDVLLVDDRKHIANLRPESSVLIRSHGGRNFFTDRELEYLAAMLKHTARLNDIRPYLLKQKFALTEQGME